MIDNMSEETLTRTPAQDYPLLDEHTGGWGLGLFRDVG